MLRGGLTQNSSLSQKELEQGTQNESSKQSQKGLTKNIPTKILGKTLKKFYINDQISKAMGESSEENNNMMSPPRQLKSNSLLSFKEEPFNKKHISTSIEKKLPYQMESCDISNNSFFVLEPRNFKKSTDIKTHMLKELSPDTLSSSIRKDPSDIRGAKQVFLSTTTNAFSHSKNYYFPNQRPNNTGEVIDYKFEVRVGSLPHIDRGKQPSLSTSGMKIGRFSSKDELLEDMRRKAESNDIMSQETRNKKKATANSRYSEESLCESRTQQGDKKDKFYNKIKEYKDEETGSNKKKFLDDLDLKILEELDNSKLLESLNYEVDLSDIQGQMSKIKLLSQINSIDLSRFHSIEVPSQSEQNQKHKRLNPLRKNIINIQGVIQGKLQALKHINDEKNSLDGVSWLSLFEYMHSIYSSSFKQLTEQVKRECIERGELLDKIWEANNRLVSRLITGQAKEKSKIEWKSLEIEANLHKTYQNELEKLAVDLKQDKADLSKKSEYLEKILDECRYLRKKNENQDRMMKELKSQLNSLRFDNAELLRDNMRLSSASLDIDLSSNIDANERYVRYAQEMIYNMIDGKKLPTSTMTKISDYINSLKDRPLNKSQPDSGLNSYLDPFEQIKKILGENLINDSVPDDDEEEADEFKKAFLQQTAPLPESFLMLDKESCTKDIFTVQTQETATEGLIIRNDAQTETIRQKNNKKEFENKAVGPGAGLKKESKLTQTEEPSNEPKPDNNDLLDQALGVAVNEEVLIEKSKSEIVFGSSRSLSMKDFDMDPNFAKGVRRQSTKLGIKTKLDNRRETVTSLTTTLSPVKKNIKNKITQSLFENGIITEESPLLKPLKIDNIPKSGAKKPNNKRTSEASGQKTNIPVIGTNKEGVISLNAVKSKALNIEEENENDISFLREKAEGVVKSSNKLKDNNQSQKLENLKSPMRPKNQKEEQPKDKKIFLFDIESKEKPKPVMDSSIDLGLNKEKVYIKEKFEKKGSKVDFDLNKIKAVEKQNQVSNNNTNTSQQQKTMKEPARSKNTTEIPSPSFKSKADDAAAVNTLLKDLIKEERDLAKNPIQHFERLIEIPAQREVKKPEDDKESSPRSKFFTNVVDSNEQESKTVDEPKPARTQPLEKLVEGLYEKSLGCIKEVEEGRSIELKRDLNLLHTDVIDLQKWITSKKVEMKILMEDKELELNDAKRQIKEFKEQIEKLEKKIVEEKSTTITEIIIDNQERKRKSVLALGKPMNNKKAEMSLSSDSDSASSPSVQKKKKKNVRISQEAILNSESELNTNERNSVRFQFKSMMTTPESSHKNSNQLAFSPSKTEDNFNNSKKMQIQMPTEFSDPLNAAGSPKLRESKLIKMSKDESDMPNRFSIKSAEPKTAMLPNRRATESRTSPDGISRISQTQSTSVNNLKKSKSLVFPNQKQLKHIYSSQLYKDPAKALLLSLKNVMLIKKKPMNFNAALKLMMSVYGELLKIYRKDEKLIPMNIFLYEHFIKNFGLRRVAEMKYVQFLISLIAYKTQNRVRQFAEFCGLQIKDEGSEVFEICESTAEDLEFFCECLLRVGGIKFTQWISMGNFNMDLINVTHSETREAVVILFKDRVSEQRLTEFMLKIDKIFNLFQHQKQLISAEGKNNKINFTRGSITISGVSDTELDKKQNELIIDVFLGFYKDIKRSKKTFFSSFFEVFCADSLRITLFEFSILMKYIEDRSYSKEAVAELFEEEHDGEFFTREKKLKTLSLERFIHVLFIRKILSNKAISSFLKTKESEFGSDMVIDFNDFLKNWEAKVNHLKLRLIKAKCYNNSYKKMIDFIVSQIYEDGSEEKKDEVVFLLYRILERESRRLVLMHHVRTYLPENILILDELAPRVLHNKEKIPDCI